MSCDIGKIFIKSAKIKIMRGMQYRADFVLGVFASMLLSCLYPASIYLMFSSTKGYENWNLAQITLFQGILILWNGLKDSLFGEIRGVFESVIRNGSFDMILLKPVSAIGTILTSGFYYQGVGGIFAGLLIVIYSVANNGVKLTPFIVFMLFNCLVIGLILYIAILVLYCCLVMKLISMQRIGEVIDKLLGFAGYPPEIYGSMMRVLVMIFFPIAIWAYFPSQIILGREQNGILFAAFFAVGLFLFSLLIWKRVVRAYASAGG